MSAPHSRMSRFSRTYRLTFVAQVLVPIGFLITHPPLCQVQLGWEAEEEMVLLRPSRNGVVETYDTHKA